MTPQSIVDSCRVILIDASANGWADAELLGYAQDFQAHTSMLKPDAYTIRGYIPMVAGTRQALPTDDGSIAILDMGENEASGRAVTLVERELLDTENRFWPAATQETDVQHWCADSRDPKRFDVTPPNDGNGSVECLRGAVPPAVAAGAQMGLGDQYKVAAEFFVLARAYSKNSKRQDLVKADSYMAKYMNALGIKSTAQVAVAPKVSQQVGS